jgi:hypothetical protein
VLDVRQFRAPNRQLTKGEGRNCYIAGRHRLAIDAVSMQTSMQGLVGLSPGSFTNIGA